MTSNEASTKTHTNNRKNVRRHITKTLKKTFSAKRRDTLCYYFTSQHSKLNQDCAVTKQRNQQQIFRNKISTQQNSQEISTDSRSQYRESATTTDWPNIQNVCDNVPCDF